MPQQDVRDMKRRWKSSKREDVPWQKRSRPKVAWVEEHIGIADLQIQ